MVEDTFIDCDYLLNLLLAFHPHRLFFHPEYFARGEPMVFACGVLADYIVSYYVSFQMARNS